LEWHDQEVDIREQIPLFGEREYFADTDFSDGTKKAVERVLWEKST